MAIPSPANLPATRTDAHAFYADRLRTAARKSEDHLTRSQRWLSKNDLFYLLAYTCHRKDLNRDWLFDRCREVQAEPDGFLDLWAREHGKSSIITFGLTILDILNDPEVTFGIFSHSRPIAKGFLRPIMREFEGNEELKAQFPDILWTEPRKQAPKWSEDDGIVVRRKSNPKESTVEAWGLVDGQPTSKHFKRKIYDDVVTEGSITTPEMILKTTRAWEHSDNLGSVGGADRFAGTIYHLFDTYSVMKERGIPTRIYACTKDGTEEFFKPGNAVLMPPELLAAKRRKQGPYTFGAQMLLNPTADKAQGFRKEWLKYWPCLRFENLNKIMIVDPAGSKNRESPAGPKKRRDNDYTAMWVLGLGADRKWRVCDYVRDRLNLSERTKTVFRLHRKWRPEKVGYEEYGMQADIEHVEEVQDRENYTFAITPLGGQLAKEERIKRLVPTFEQGNILLPADGIVYINYEKQAIDLIRAFIREEYEAFPVLSHDDGLDSLSRIHDDEMKIEPPSEDTYGNGLDDEDGDQEIDWMAR